MKSNCSWRWPTSRAQEASENFGKLSSNHLSASCYHLLNVSKTGALADSLEARLLTSGKRVQGQWGLCKSPETGRLMALPSVPWAYEVLFSALRMGMVPGAPHVEWTIWRGSKGKRWAMKATLMKYSPGSLQDREISKGGQGGAQNVWSAWR